MQSLDCEHLPTGNMFTPNLFHLALIISCGSITATYDISADLAPAGPLGVTLDRSFALNWPTTTQPDDEVPRNWMYSSHLTFTQPVATITDGQLWQMAIDAYNESMCTLILSPSSPSLYLKEILIFLCYQPTA
jgi:hypothetical protein